MSKQLGSLGDTAEVPSASGFGFAVVQTRGITYSRAMTLVVEATVDGGDTWFMIPATAIGHGSQVTQIWTNGRWFVETYSFDSLRVRVTEYVTGTVLVDIVPGTGLAGRMPVETEADTILLGGDTAFAVTDIQARRYDELASLKAGRSWNDQQLYGSDNYGDEIR